MKTVTVSGTRFELDRRAVERAAEAALPEPVRDHFVVVGARRWPPKQLLALVTGLDRADFTTHQARRILTNLGFSAGRAVRPGVARSLSELPAPSTPAGKPAQPAGVPVSAAEKLRPFIGQWVAVREDEVLVAAASPAEVVAWLAEHGERAQSMFRVPDSEQAIGGAAPL